MSTSVGGPATTGDFDGSGGTSFQPVPDGISCHMLSLHWVDLPVGVFGFVLGVDAQNGERRASQLCTLRALDRAWVTARKCGAVEGQRAGKSSLQGAASPLLNSPRPQNESPDAPL